MVSGTSRSNPSGPASTARARHDLPCLQWKSISPLLGPVHCLAEAVRQVNTAGAMVSLQLPSLRRRLFVRTSKGVIQPW